MPPYQSFTHTVGEKLNNAFYKKLTNCPRANTTLALASVPVYAICCLNGMCNSRMQSLYLLLQYLKCPDGKFYGILFAGATLATKITQRSRRRSKNIIRLMNSVKIKLSPSMEKIKRYYFQISIIKGLRSGSSL